MKKYFFVIFLIFYLFSCQLKKEIEPTDKPVNQIFEYNPQKAGAEIVKKITFDKADYLSYTNNSYYCIKQSSICIYDITNDVSVLKKEYFLNLNDLYRDTNYTYNVSSGFGICEIDKIIYFSISVQKAPVFSSLENNKYFNQTFCLNTENGNFEFCSFFSEIDDNIEYNYIYDNDTDVVYFSVYPRYNQREIYYVNNFSITKSFEIRTKINTIDEYDITKIFFTNQHIISQYYVHIRANNYIINKLNIYKVYYSNEIVKKLDLTYLKLYNKPLSAFSDSDGNIWLYVHEYDSETTHDKYELVKLRLLE